MLARSAAGSRRGRARQVGPERESAVADLVAGLALALEDLGTAASVSLASAARRHNRRAPGRGPATSPAEEPLAPAGRSRGRGASGAVRGRPARSGSDRSRPGRRGRHGPQQGPGPVGAAEQRPDRGRSHRRLERRAAAAAGCPGTSALRSSAMARTAAIWTASGCRGSSRSTRTPRDPSGSIVPRTAIASSSAGSGVAGSSMRVRACSTSRATSEAPGPAAARSTGSRPPERRTPRARARTSRSRRSPTAPASYVEDTTDLVGPVPRTDDLDELFERLQHVPGRAGAPVSSSSSANSRSAVAAHELSTAARIQRFAASRAGDPGERGDGARVARLAQREGHAEPHPRIGVVGQLQDPLRADSGEPLQPAARRAGPPGRGPPARGRTGATARSSSRSASRPSSDQRALTRVWGECGSPDSSSLRSGSIAAGSWRS